MIAIAVFDFWRCSMDMFAPMQIDMFKYSNKHPVKFFEQVFIFRISSLITEFGHAYVYIRFLMRKYLAVTWMSNGFWRETKKNPPETEEKKKLKCYVVSINWSIHVFHVRMNYLFLGNI